MDNSVNNTSWFTVTLLSHKGIKKIEDFVVMFSENRVTSLSQSIYSIGTSSRSGIRLTGLAYISFFAVGNCVYIKFLYQIKDMWGNPVSGQCLAFKCKTIKQADFLVCVFNRIIITFFGN